MTTGTVTTVVTEIQAIGDTILETLKVADPAVALPAEAAETVFNLIGELVSKALTAYSAAAGIPITVDTVSALLPNPTPLSTPTA